MVGGDYVPRNLACLAEDGRHVSIAFQRGAKAEIAIADVMRRRLTLTGSTLRPRPVEFKTMVAEEIAHTVWPYVEGGRLKPIIDSIFPLSRGRRSPRADGIGRACRQDRAGDRRVSERPILHEYRRSGNCYKVRLTAALTEMPLERREYDIMKGETRTPEFLANVNTNGRIPVLQIGDRFIPESNAACHYLAEGSNLIPADRSTTPICCAGCSGSSIITSRTSRPCGFGSAGSD